MSKKYKSGVIKLIQIHSRIWMARRYLRDPTNSAGKGKQGVDVLESALSHAHIVDSCTRTSLARRFRLMVVDDTEVIFAGMER